MNQTLMSPEGAVSTRRRNGTIAIVSALLWLLVIFFVWANRPHDDSVPTGEINIVNDDNGVTELVFTTQTVRCNGLFAGDLIASDPLPSVEAPREYTRPPCELPRNHGRIAFGINLAMVTVVVAGGAALIASKPTGR